MSKAREHVHFHKDGTVWARGQMLGDQMHGYWEFFRKDGTKLRSGSFDRGEKVGDWTTYDAAGKVYKVTAVKPKAPQPKALGVRAMKQKAAGKENRREPTVRSRA